MSIANRFRDALGAVSDPAVAAPELLPTRLARAVAHMLPVDGAGLSLLDGKRRRVPLGASSEMAACAERLQFTAGYGPCTTAHEQGEPVFAALEDLQRRWPAFTELLVDNTPYRAVVALPLPESLSGAGAMDLLFEDATALPSLDVFEALALAQLVTSELGEAAVWSTWAPDRGPDWMHGPPAQRRAAVWQATGVVCVAFEVDAPTALETMRAYALANGRAVDDVAADLLEERLRPDDLR